MQGHARNHHIINATYIFVEGMLHGLRVMIFYMRQALYIYASHRALTQDSS